MEVSILNMNYRRLQAVEWHLDFSSKNHGAISLTDDSSPLHRSAGQVVFFFITVITCNHFLYRKEQM